jgi:hypothetical protein
VPSRIFIAAAAAAILIVAGATTDVDADRLAHTFSIVARDAAPIFRQLFAKEPFWAELLRRLPAAGLFPKDAALLGRMLALAPSSRGR